MQRVYLTPEEMLTSLIATKSQKEKTIVAEETSKHYSFLNPIELSKSKTHNYKNLVPKIMIEKITTNDSKKSSVSDLHDISYHTIDLNPLNSCSSSSKSNDSNLSFNISESR